jgi:hypothetical protein
LPVWPTCQSFGRVARVHRGAARAHGRAQLVGQRRHDFVELLGAAQRAATGDDDLGGGEFGAVVLGDLAAHEAALAAVGHRSHGFHGGAAASGGRGSKPVVRTVMTLVASALCTVAIALPA